MACVRLELPLFKQLQRDWLKTRTRARAFLSESRRNTRTCHVDKRRHVALALLPVTTCRQDGGGWLHDVVGASFAGPVASGCGWVAGSARADRAGRINDFDEGWFDMRTKQTHITAGLAIIALAVIATVAYGQTLSKSQVRDLAANASTPAQHVQLRDHFASLADRYEAEAKRHATMAAVNAGNPNRRIGAGSDHWRRLSESVAAMAKDARELAAFHEQLASGEPAIRPTDSSHLEHGTGAPTKMSDADLQRLVASAQTPSDHGKLQEYFLSLVAEYTRDADDHAAMAVGYRGNQRSGMVSAVDHCDRLARQARNASAEAKALASEHAALAK